MQTSQASWTAVGGTISPSTAKITYDVSDVPYKVGDKIAYSTGDKKEPFIECTILAVAPKPRGHREGLVKVYFNQEKKNLFSKSKTVRHEGWVDMEAIKGVIGAVDCCDPEVSHAMLKSANHVYCWKCGTRVGE